LQRTRRKRAPQPARLIAYDFETTRIEPGTPRPLYLTAYAKDVLHFSESVQSMAHLHDMLVNNFLTPELVGVKFCAWAGNNFDAYFIAAALIEDSRFVLRPYLTRTNSLRGLRVILAEDVDKRNARAWEFVDGMAQLGLVGVSLAKFLATYAPDYAKLTGVIDFEREQFDSTNLAHCEYAMRDSVGLYWGMTRAQSILMEKFDEPLRVTMGATCIRIFKANIPEGVEIPTPRDEVLRLIRDYVMRGGFCYCVRRYSGPVWKYDLNQAYAAAMRDALLPAGFTQHSRTSIPHKAQVYIARIRAVKRGNIIPFYYRTEIAGRVRAVFSVDEIADTWITSIEVDQLRAEHWKIEVLECYAWESSFQMRDYVDTLERGRRSAEGGPSGPIGTVYKNVGNHSYGKTVEQIEPLEFVLAKQCPSGFAPYYGDGAEPIEHVFFRLDEDQRPKDYHQPQLGAFITAHVRMMVRRAALIDPVAWLYADTDCVVFSRDVTDRLDIDPSRYGSWKIEESGEPYQIIAKKVYAQIGGAKRSAKGLNVKKLTTEHFTQWFEGSPPVQNQVQRNNFLKVMQGLEMFRAQTRRGTAVAVTPQASELRVS
jgi:hypothetical protein